MAKNAETVTNKELYDLVSTLSLCEPRMAGTHTGILQKFDQNLIIDIRDPVFVLDIYIFFLSKKRVFPQVRRKEPFFIDT